jgi:alpha-glucosidase
LHSAYSFFLLRAASATPELFQRALHGWDNAAGWPSWSLSNHDVVRVATRFGDDKPQRVKLLLAVLLSMRGTAFLYQGDELGLPHANVSYERLRDPEAIAFWPHGIGRDGARTPMPWTITKPMVGFTIGDDTWLPVDPRHRAMAVDVQEDDPDSVLHFTRAFIASRRASAALRVGALKHVVAAPSVLAFEREADGDRVLCLFNLGSETARHPVPNHTPLSSVGTIEFQGGEVVLDGYSAVLIAV